MLTQICVTMASVEYTELIQLLNSVLYMALFIVFGHIHCLKLTSNIFPNHDMDR